MADRWSVGSVEANDGVEVDQPAALVLGDLGERQPPVVGPVAGADAEGGGQGAAQVGGEPRPQHPGVGLPEHRAVVVVAVWIEGGTDPRVVAVVALPAAQGRTWPRGVTARVWTGPNDGAVRVTNARGCSTTVTGTPLVSSPASPARSRWNASAQ